MPQKLDRDERRRQVSEAAWRVLVRDGLEALSVRNVAAEAGLPQSSLRYTFPTVASVRERAVALVLERLQERVAAVDVDGASWSREVLAQLLPLDAERRTEMEVYLALGTAAMTDPALRDGHRASQDAIRDVCARALAALTGRAPSGVEVRELHALVDGLALHVVRQDPDADAGWALDVLDTHLERVAG
ncbi:TetR/AcrR family transcriptional regulator [Isoptericola sp. QY 916]|uniref:TetR/AcrR family transcriptional regulator n=1 Tax=Isoptericola sp. QY 916 TaxID=2782570 RepID=UPI003D3008BD|nr:TetR family transcriptional regulator C-terminal domain-containing protein [Isoptericola sp. QY 916]